MPDLSAATTRMSMYGGTAARLGTPGAGTPAERVTENTTDVLAEPRTLEVRSQSRTLDVVSESRTLVE